MKKNKFIFLSALALFIMLPFGVRAESKFEVIDKYDGVVYTIEESDYVEVLESCSTNVTINVNDWQYFDSLSTEDNMFLVDRTDRSNKKYYLYNIESGTCIEKTEAEAKALSETLSEDAREISYKVSNGKLYKVEIHQNAADGYGEVYSSKITSDGEYFTDGTSIKELVTDNTFCKNSSNTCYERKLFMLFTADQIQNDVTYYHYTDSDSDGNLQFSPIANPDACVSTSLTCYYEVERDKYYKETELTNIDMNNFDFVADGLTTTNDLEITSYFEFDGTKYIVIEDSYLYTIDGEMTIPTNNSDNVVNPFVVVDDKYIVNIVIVNDESYKIQIYDNKFNVIYEKNYDHSSNATLIEWEMFVNIQSHNNLVSLFKEYYSDNYDTGVYDETMYLFNIRDYRLLDGANQTFNENDLTFKTNGNLDRFAKVLVDNNELTTNDFTKVSGSTIITLNKDYLNTLSNGEHTLKITYNDGGYVETEFTVAKNTPTSTEYTVIFDANGGTFTNGSLLTFDKWEISFADSLEEPTKDGYTFKGFYTEKTGGMPFEIVNNYSVIKGDITFYAQWEENSTQTNPTNPEEENPKTFDGIGTSIFMGTISLIGLVGATIYLKKRNKVRA